MLELEAEDDEEDDDDQDDDDDDFSLTTKDGEFDLSALMDEYDEDEEDELLNTTLTPADSSAAEDDLMSVQQLFERVASSSSSSSSSSTAKDSVSIQDILSWRFVSDLVSEKLLSKADIEKKFYDIAGNQVKSLNVVQFGEFLEELVKSIYLMIIISLRN
jgi:hypothetical protein